MKTWRLKVHSQGRLNAGGGGGGVVAFCATSRGTNVTAVPGLSETKDRTEHPGLERLQQTETDMSPGSICHLLGISS